MYEFTSDELDIAKLRERLHRMTDRDLQRFGLAASRLSDPVIQRGIVRTVFVVQLEEARAEWRRRHPALEHTPAQPGRA